MRAVLGIDTAWTASQPSGVALIANLGDGWHSVALAPSYAAFLALAEGTPVDWTARHRGEGPAPSRLLAACRKLLDGVAPSVVAVDMLLATVPITCRRAADSRTSRHFGRFGCAVHSPSAIRPGPIGLAMSSGFDQTGYPLATASSAPGTTPALLEVYPHPAILRLMALERRLPYKASRSGRYWKHETPRPSAAERCSRLLAAFERLKRALMTNIAGVGLPLPPAGTATSLSALKPYEDALDALVCCWVGAEYLAGRAEAFGDDTAAIWVPTARTGL